MSKLFYNVQKDKANEFKTNVSNALGFVAETDNAGYIIANGKEYGKTRVSASNSFVVNGAQYSIIVDGTGALSVSKYIATSIKSVDLSSILDGVISTTIDENYVASGSAEKYIGESYVLGVEIHTKANQEIQVNVSNETGNKYKLAIYDGSTYILNDTSYTRTTSGIISYSAVNAMDDVGPVEKRGNVQWAETKLSASTSGEKTFTVYLTESGKTPIVMPKTQPRITGNVSITPKVPFLYGKNGTSAGCTYHIKDIKRGNIGSFEQNFTFNKGDIPTFAIPTCIGKTLKCFNDTGSMEDTSLTYIGKETVNLHGCNTDYDIYKYGSQPWVGSATIKIKY